LLGCRNAYLPAASFPVEEIIGAATEGLMERKMAQRCHSSSSCMWTSSVRKSERLLKHVEKLGAKAIFVTVDAPVAGKREADERVKAD